MMKRQLSLTIETRQVQIIRTRPLAYRSWCTTCADETERLTPEQTARRVGLNARWLYRQLEAARLPFVETTDGLPLLCVACVARPQA